jgi:adenylate cyclase
MPPGARLTIGRLQKFSITAWRRNGALARSSTRIVRAVRLSTGLILFTFASCHLLNHAFGIRSIAAMQAASVVLLEPWQTIPGLWLLYGAFITHATLGLMALYRRRHLRMPAAEAWQLALGLSIPLLVIPHAAGIRIGQSLFGLDYDFARVVHAIWDAPDTVVRQYLLLMVLWVHGCIGLRAWLGAKPWYGRAAAALASLALLVPVLGLIGFTNAGLDIREAVARDPGLAARLAIGPPGTAAGTMLDQAKHIAEMLVWSYVGLVAATFALRLARDWHARRFRAVHIGYPDGRAVTVPLGFSVLEASRWAGIPHVSVCGGQGRCSTCRVRIIESADSLPPPGELEMRTLARIGNPVNVRLACQLRPRGAVRVEPLLRAGSDALSGAVRFDAAAAGGAEMEVAALFVDLRESTRLAAGRLPYDTLFIFDRYIQVITSAVRAHGGHVTSIAGDGVMAMFVDGAGDSAQFTRRAFAAALQLWEGVDALNQELAAELRQPLRIGIGLHVGPAVVGTIAAAGLSSLQFLGDTGNLAAKFQAETRRLDCTLIASAQAVALVAPQRTDPPVGLTLPGEREMMVVPMRTPQTLRDMLAPAPGASP